MNDEEPLWSAKQVAEYLGVSERQVSERYSMYPGFPEAIRLPSPKGQGISRWVKSEIIGWVKNLRKAA